MKTGIDGETKVSTGRKKHTYDRIAFVYDVLDFPFEMGRYEPVRPRLFMDLSGSILDAGVGTGRNMPFYPTGSEVVGIDISPQMLRRARRRRDQLGLKVDLREMDVCDIAYPDGHFDHIVATFLFCVLEPPDQLLALQELTRVCRAGGTVRLLEYSYSSDRTRRFIMRLWAPWVRFAYGAAFDRNTAQYFGASGLELIESTRVYKDILMLHELQRPRCE